MSSTSSSESRDSGGAVVDNNDELETIARQFRENVDIDDRTYHFKIYKQCFVGSDAVDYLVKSGQAASREDAVELGRALQSPPFYLFEHVTRDHAFQDAFKFYRFVDHAVERGSKNFKVVEEESADGDEGNKTTTESVGWSDFFLMPATGTSGSGKGSRSGSPYHPTLPKPDFEALKPNDVHVASRVWPLDELNTELLDNVHPPDWQDPLVGADDVYDLVVIGAGAGGLVTSAGAAGVGAKVALIEEHLLGGDW